MPQTRDNVSIDLLAVSLERCGPSVSGRVPFELPLHELSYCLFILGDVFSILKGTQALPELRLRFPLRSFDCFTQELPLAVGIRGTIISDFPATFSRDLPWPRWLASSRSPALKWTRLYPIFGSSSSRDKEEI
jgi:hypothetical protein